MLTRYALIDPLLRELGWDTEDPGTVVPEYRVPNNKIADYVLFHAGRPEIVVEAKKLDESFGKALDQGILSCAHTGADYFLLTDGNRWELYKSGSTSPKTSFNLTDASATEACMKALALWRSSVISGRIQAGQMPVTGLIDEPPSTTTHQPTGETSVQSPPPTNQTTVQETPPVTDEQGWQPLSKLEPKLFPPTDILFPDKSTVDISAWMNIKVEVLRWLINNKFLDESHCPIRRYPGRTRYLVATDPRHSNNTKFKAPGSIGCFHFEKHWVPPEIILNVRHIIKHVGQDPAQFKVRFPAP